MRDLGIADPEKKVDIMAKPNYGFEKRQRELAKQKKKEEKRQHKLERSHAEETAGEQPGTADGTARRHNAGGGHIPAVNADNLHAAGGVPRTRTDYGRRRRPKPRD